VKSIIQTNAKPEEIPHVSNAIDLVKITDASILSDAGIYAPSAYAWPDTLPRVGADLFRAGFNPALKDGELLAEMKNRSWRSIR
jgi:hypothetical protein